jgi:hypothetical protein
MPRWRAGADPGEDVQVDPPSVQLILEEFFIERAIRSGLDHEGVAGLEQIQRGHQLGTLTAGACRLDDDLAAVGGGEHVELGLVVLDRSPPRACCQRLSYPSSPPSDPASAEAGCETPAVSRWRGAARAHRPSGDRSSDGPRGEEVMAVDPTVPGGAGVLLYDTAGLIEGVGGVLIRVDSDHVDVALVTPWPPTLTDSTPFAVAVMVSPEPEWRKPGTVEVFQLEGAQDGTNVAAVILPGPLIPSAVGLPLTSAYLKSALPLSGNLQKTLDIAFERGFRKDHPATLNGVATSAPAGSVQAPEQPIKVTLGDAAKVINGLCRIFHWD